MCVHKKRKSHYTEEYYCVNTSANFRFHFSNKILYVLYSASNTYSCIREYESWNSCIRNTRNNGKLRMYIERNLWGSILIMQLVSRSLISAVFIILRRRWGDIVRLIKWSICYQLIAEKRKKGWNPASRMQQCNLVVYYFLRIFDTIGRILKNVRTGKYKMKFLLQCRVHMFLDTIYF